MSKWERWIKKSVPTVLFYFPSLEILRCVFHGYFTFKKIILLDYKIIPKKIDSLTTYVAVTPALNTRWYLFIFNISEAVERDASGSPEIVLLLSQLEGQARSRVLYLILNIVRRYEYIPLVLYEQCGLVF